MFLTDDELRRLTGRARAKSQAEALRRLGIRYVVNQAGRVIVLRAHAERRLDGVAHAPPEPVKPNFAAIRRVA